MKPLRIVVTGSIALKVLRRKEWLECLKEAQQTPLVEPGTQRGRIVLMTRSCVTRYLQEINAGSFVIDSISSRRWDKLNQLFRAIGSLSALEEVVFEPSRKRLKYRIPAGNHLPGDAFTAFLDGGCEKPNPTQETETL
jgi:hypothetical protein